MNLLELPDAVVIVTGASSGIGEATARLLAKAGAHPVLAARRADRLSSLSADLGDALAVVTDVTDRAAIDRLVAATLDRYGRIDGLVNNAGESLHGALETIDAAKFASVLELNVIGIVSMMQAVIPAMRSRGSGRIVNVSSGTTRMVLPGAGAYAATKSAVNMLTSVARVELATDGIDVSVVLPSITATEFGGGMFVAGTEARPGMPVQDPSFVGRVILRLLQTGEERIDIMPGAEDESLTVVPR